MAKTRWDDVLRKAGISAPVYRAPPSIADRLSTAAIALLVYIAVAGVVVASVWR
jgi:hypothetical protein